MHERSIVLIGNFLSKHVHTRSIAEELSGQLKGRGWKVLTTSSQKSRSARLIDILWTIWSRRNDYRLAHIDVFSGLAFWWAYLTARLLHRLKVPFLITLHGGNLPPFAERHADSVRWLLQVADAVTTPSTYLKLALTPFRKDILLVRNAIDLSKYPFAQRSKPRSDIAWLRAFHRIYAPSTAVEMLALLREQFSDIHLTMFGPDKGDGSLADVEQIAEAHQLGESLTIAGGIPKARVPHELAKHDIFINTTTAESFGVSVIEAGALGLCIVTTNVGELPQIWTHDHDALLVPPNDPQAMADAIRRILTEPGLAERLSCNARKTAEQFDWAVVLPQWEALLTDVIEKDRRGGHR